MSQISDKNLDKKAVNFIPFFFMIDPLLPMYYYVPNDALLDEKVKLVS
jgi:hypothetical protein